MTLKTNLKELKGLVTYGSTILLNDYNTFVKGLRVVALSTGLYGINGALLIDPKTNQTYAIIGRCSCLFYYL